MSESPMERGRGPEPTEPLGTVRSTVGTCMWFNDEKGYGAIATEDTGPWDVWCHFSAIEAPGFRALQPGQRVEVTYERANQDSFKYRALSARALA